MGVPVLTLARRPPVGRIGASLMINLGLPEWVAESEDEYIDKACLCPEPRCIGGATRGHARADENSPLMDGVGFARGVEAAYRGMFEKWASE